MKSGYVESSSFVLFQNSFGNSESLEISYKFWNGFFYFWKECHRDFDCGCTESEFQIKKQKADISYCSVYCTVRMKVNFHVSSYWPDFSYCK